MILNAVVYVPDKNRLYCIHETEDCGFSTYTDHPDYPFFWWTWDELDTYFKHAIYIGVL